MEQFAHQYGYLGVFLKSPIDASSIIFLVMLRIDWEKVLIQYMEKKGKRSRDDIGNSKEQIAKIHCSIQALAFLPGVWRINAKGFQVSG